MRGAGLVWRPSRGHPWAWSIGREGKTSAAWYRFLAVCAHQSGHEAKRKGDGPATQANHYKLLVTVIIKGGGRNLTPITHGLVVITGLVG